jgi:pyruvate/2-oxoglutarate dehydrogenase complex dihydrolipoamide dehydrogenase (E3) component
MAQAFRRLGSRVTVMEASERLLPHDEPEASRLLAQVFDEEGITVLTPCHVERVWQDDNGADIHVRACDEEILGDALLVATGRRPNVAGLALDNAGVDYDEKGVKVDDKLRTSQPGIYAAGDCLGSYLFTHYAGRQGLTAARNALLPGASRGTRAWVPWTTFTQPEVAHAGLTERRAREREAEPVETLMWSLDEIDRAHTEGDTQGFIKLVMRKNGSLLGVTIVADRAGELIHAWMYMLEGVLKLRDLVNTMHVYPTYSLANVKAAGALLERRTLGGRFGPAIRWLGRVALKVMRWRRDL